MRLSDFFTTIYRPQRLLGKSPNTTRLIEVAIRNFGRTIATAPRLEHLTDDLIRQHMQAQLDKGRTIGTANRDASTLLAMWRHAHKLGMIEKYPQVTLLQEPQRTPEAWTAEQLARLFDTIDRQEGHFGPVPRSLWWRTLVMVCLETAERVGAVRQAQWGWISGNWINVPAEARKGGRRDRAYRLSPETVGHLLAIRMVSPKKVFPWPYSDGYLWRLFGELLGQAGLPAGRRNKFHMLRRTTASAVYAAGMDPQEALDHQYRRTTKRYLDPRFQRSEQACDVLASFLEVPRVTKKKKAQ